MRGVLTHDEIAFRVRLLSPARTVSSFFRSISVVIVLCAMLGTAGCMGVTGKPIISSPTNPAGASISITPTTVNFGTVNVGATASQSMLIANNGTADLAISQVSTVGSGFSLSNLSSSTTVPAGQSATFTATFKPASAGSAAGSISIASNAPESPMTISLSGVGESTNQGTPYISVNPSSVNFGNVIVGNTDSQILTVSNSGTANLTVSSLTPSGSGFSVYGLSFPFTLSPGQNATFTAAFGPASPGGQSGSVSIANNTTGSPLVVGLSGTGVAATYQLSASYTSLNFGNVNMGSLANQNVTLTNTGNSNVNISSVSVSGAGFTESGGSNETLTPNQSTTITVTFKPGIAGAASGNLSVASNAQNSPLAISLSGTGVQSAQPSVALNWQPSTSQVIGYFVYRKSSTQTQYSKLNSSVVPSTSYTDATVSTNQTYDYAVTSVDSSNIESAFSNQVTVNIP
jgi:Abnormal spindle-like microcephaly-assoc'd, ASPM-SPD-2-Hydin/Protein of unknown function (DUF1573)